ncbi:hypothetical protein [Undibacterium terreum]|uniref:Uncharacterized protein n=1 Tax=Undibacterium terreum TaxID=1224302 RepID=A0A916UAY8_9BURK|nr:hypothetical protein [Undibacterium terreum]GGC65562.1 hypothetical protein GCM10011396_10730 [Undibacterium terreum]
MRGYAKISPKFWISGTGEKLRDEGWQAQLVALYLMSSPQANMTGLYYLPKPFMLAETGLSLDDLTKGLQACIRSGFCQYDEKSRMVWVHEMARFQIGKKLKPRDKRAIGVQTEYDNLPDNPYLQAFYDKYAVALCMSYSRANEPAEQAAEAEGKDLPDTLPSASKKHRSQEQEQEQEQDKGQNPANTSVLAVASDAGNASSGGGKQASATGDAAASGTAGPSLSDSAQSTAREKDPPRAEAVAMACPHQEIIALYHQVLPQCPRVRDWTRGRAVHLRARWNEDPARQNLDYWRKFFEYVAGSAFLTGRAQLAGGTGKRSFMADLAWMTKAINFAKIREGQYDN